MPLLFQNIRQLVQVRDDSIPYVAGEDMKILPTLEHAFLLVENGLIKDFGAMSNCPTLENVEIIDVTDRLILPTWCDSHTHLVYAGSREGEFVDRLNGLSYTEIARRGGGILNSAKLLNETSEESLYEQSKNRLEEVIRLGTGAIEIKSGYGLTVAGELKMLRVIKRLRDNYPIPIKATFLGAHALPAQFKNNKSSYLNLLIDKVLPIIARENLAEYVDVFCETDYFDLDDTALILAAGKAYNLRPKIHVNQFTNLGGIAIAVKFGALSVDHLEVLNEADIEVLKGSETMPVALPGCSYFLGIPYTPARRLITAGLPVALATDYNPGSAPSGNMNFVVATACVKMKLTPEEAINAATVNGAYAMGLQNVVGSIGRGKQANLILTKPIPSYHFIPYAFGSNLVEKVYIDGKEWKH